MAKSKEVPKIPSELAFVLSCVTEEKKDNIPALLDHGLDWEEVKHLSLSHRLFPLVYSTLNYLGKSQVPQEVLKLLQQQSIVNALKVTSQNDEILRIIKELDEHKINPIILKGSPLSAKINEDIALRPSSDIDMLVDPLEFDQTEIVLEQMGYRRYSPDFQLTPRQRITYLETHHHFEYYHSQRATVVELHWKIRSFNIRKVPTAYHMGKQKVYISGCPITVMDNENWLLFLMIHGYKHFWARLRWLYDIKEFMRIPIDWNKVKVLADMYETSVILHQSLILLNYLFGVPIPGELGKYVQVDKKALNLANFVIDNLNKKVTRSESAFSINKILHNYHYKNYTIKNKLDHLRMLCKPGLADFKLISLPDVLFPVYYLIRPVYHLVKCIPFLNVVKPEQQ